ncbi:tudor domain-containing protein 6 isoform X1 [Sinocyclocheilus anshuiensis]|uniref:tudor domain-containing protein 6 isoform X1 n=1 Tax=Sinocyclocheilus anshuiensis TaxID=1608454 RepID=UPI0007B8C961|nr:PREDICTED: tudor domain-containing protein 6-like isoform X1 [Sinocyclocheilus anshuiensis]
MCSFPGLPEVGSNTTVHITRVNLNPHTVLVEFGGSLNNGQENREAYQHLKKDLEIPRKRQHAFEGKPGEVCLVYEDGTWHRARILSKSEHECKVFLIDDGKLLWVSSEVLTKCPHNLCSVPPKVELCILASASALCLESAWSVAASTVIRSLCGKDISGCVQDVIMPSRIIILDIPSLSKQMYELGFARKMPNKDFKNLVMHSLHLPRRNPSIQTDLVTTNGQQEHASDPDKLHQYLYPELLSGAVEIVTVTQVIHPLKIYCKLHVFSQELKKLSDQLHEYYENSFSVQMPMLLYDGSPCATKGSDGKWYRSVLQQNNVSDVVKVFHVDYGIGDFVKLCNIRPLSARFFKLPVVTYACSLHGVIDKGIGWRTEQIDYLKSVVLDQILVGKFEHYSANEGVYYIRLYGNDNVNVNDTFGHRERCLSTTERICGDQTLKTLNKVAHKNMYGRDVPVHSLDSTTLTECSDSLKDVTVARPSKIGKNLQPAEGSPSSNVTAAPPFQNEAYVVSQPKSEVGAKEKVRITCVQSVNQFYGHFAQNTDTVRKMTKDIQQLCRKQPQEKFSIYPKMMCLAKYADGLWHRGQIESMHPILVQFVDYGDLVVLDKSDVLPLPPKASAIASIPIQAVQFELFNVTLPEPCELNEWFKNYATDCMFTVIMKQNSSGKLSVEMYDEKTNLNSNIKEQWNQKSKRKGFNISKGTEKAHTFNTSSEGVESRGVRHNFSTTSKAHEKTSKNVPKPDFQGTLEQNFQTVTSHTTGHSRARPNFLQQQVSCHYPKLTDLPSRALDAGYVSDIYVSHCNSPSSFFVQLASDEGEIFSLLDKLNSAQLSDAQVELDLLQSGDLVVAEYTADGTWYRAVVQNKKNGMVQVRFIDFGNEATLLPLKIRQLGKQFLSTPRFSIHCTLEDGRRGKRDWTQEEIMTFKKAAGENGEKTIQCKFIQKDASAWIVSLELGEGPLFNAVLKPGAQPESQMHCSEGTQPLAFKDPAVTQGQIVDAYASSIVGPNYFWCQFKNSEELDTISLLAQEIGNSSQTKPIQPDQLCHGPCLALFSDQLWYRAQVINTHSKTVSVLFIDYGNESEIDLNFVKSLPTKLLESPPEAFLCQLDALGSVDGTWSDAAADKFFELLVDEPLKVTIQNTVMSSDLSNCPHYNVLVECNGLIVNDLMKDYWCDPKPQVCSKVTMGAKTKPTASEHSFGVKSSETVQKDNAPKLNSGELNSEASNNVNPDLHGFDPQISPNKLVAAETQEQSITYPTLTAVDESMMVPELSVQCLPQAVDLPPRMIEPGKVSEVYVSHINSLTSFFAQLVEDEKTLFSLTELLNSHQPSEKDDIHASSVQQGSLVKAMFPEDDSWYRAVVKDTTQNGMIQVEFIDFGNEATVSLLKIRRLDEQLLSYPRFSIHCSCSLDDQFKMQKGMEQTFLFKKIFGEAGENMLSCKFIKEDGITWEVKMTPSGSSSDSNEKWDSLDVNASPVVSEPVKETFQLLFKKPDVSLGQTVEAFASCIVGPDYFWCQFSNSEILDQITLVAQEYGNSSETQLIKVDNLDPGSLCLARFCDDQMWYRAQVINKCTNVVSVLFVDFGNESETSEGSVKALPCDLLESPPQAFLCQLEGFGPSKGSWDSAATDNFYELLVDKPLKVTVQCIDSTTDPNPPYYVKVESPQCLVNELMMKFWSGSAQNDQNSSEVIESCEKSIASTSDRLASEDKTSVSLEISTEDMHTIEPHGAEQHGADQIELLVKGDLHGVPEKKVADQLDGADVIAAVTNSDVIADDPTGMNLDLEIHEVCHESDEDNPVVSTEQVLRHTEKSRKDIEHGGSEKAGNPMTSSRSTDWVAGLENQILPMVCTDDSCDSKCIFK